MLLKVGCGVEELISSPNVKILLLLRSSLPKESLFPCRTFILFDAIFGIPFELNWEFMLSSIMTVLESNLLM